MRRKEGPIKKDKENSFLPFMSRLLGNTWEEHVVPGTGPKSSSNFIQAPFPPSLTFFFSFFLQPFPTDRHVYRAVGSDRIMFATDLWYRSDGQLRAIAEVI